MIPYASAVRNVVRVQSSTRKIRVTVAGKCVYNEDQPRSSDHAFVLLVVSLDTLKVVSTTIFNIREVAGANDMFEFLSSFLKSRDEDILVVAATNRSVPRKCSPVVTSVLRSLRTVGGSLHVLDQSYVLVGAKYTSLLNGLVHEDHQSGKATVTVDVRVIRHNRDSVTVYPLSHGGMDREEMTPVRWQWQKNVNNHHGAAWQDLRRWSAKLTSAYQRGAVKLTIDDKVVDLVKMKVQEVKIRCLNWKGETLAPLSRPGGTDNDC